MESTERLETPPFSLESGGKINNGFLSDTITSRIHTETSTRTEGIITVEELGAKANKTSKNYN